MAGQLFLYCVSVCFMRFKGEGSYKCSNPVSKRASPKVCKSQMNRQHDGTNKSTLSVIFAYMDWVRNKAPASTRIRAACAERGLAPRFSDSSRRFLLQI